MLSFTHASLSTWPVTPQTWANPLTGWPRSFRNNSHSLHFPRRYSYFATVDSTSLKSCTGIMQVSGLYYRRLERGTFQWPNWRQRPAASHPAGTVMAARRLVSSPAAGSPSRPARSSHLTLSAGIRKRLVEPYLHANRREIPFRLAQQKRFDASSEKTHRREGKWPFGHFANRGDAGPARGSGSSCRSTVA